MVDSQPVPEQQSQNSWISRNSWKKTELTEKFELPEKEERAFLPPWPTPIYKLSLMSMVWNISIGHLGGLSGYASPQLLRTCSLAEYGILEKKSLIS